MPRRLSGLHTVPGRIRTLPACAMLAIAGLFAVTAVALWQAREGLRAVGGADGRTVIATADLYAALTDMDLQVTNVLLTGQEAGWLCDTEAAEQTEQIGETGEAGQAAPAPPDEVACDRAPARVLYDFRREAAQRAALAAARLADGDPVRLSTVQAVLDGLYEYDQRVQAAMERGRQADHPFGMPPPDAVARYRFATALMTDELLPGAYNLTLDGQVSVHATED